MKQYRLNALAAIVAIAAVAGVSAPASDGALLAPAAGSLTITLHGTSVGCAPRAATRGRTTLVVRNARKGVSSFVLARHTGGIDNLPRVEGIPFVPSDAIAARLHRIPAGKQRQLAATLTPGEYLLVATPSASGMVFVAAARSFRVT